MNHYQYYCANCGRLATEYHYIPYPKAHRPGDWVIEFYNIEDLLYGGD